MLQHSAQHDGKKLIRVANWAQESWFCSLPACKGLLNLKICQGFCADLVKKPKNHL